MCCGWVLGRSGKADEMREHAAELAVAQEAARAGGDVVMRYFREGVTMRSKQACDLVSDADVESEQAIMRVISDAFPQHVTLGEESHRGDVTAEHLWIVDPLDGTTNFAHGVSRFAVSVAYYRAGIPLVGVIHDPVYGDWYVAVKGGGAFANGEPVRVSTSRKLSDELIGVGFYYDRGNMMRGTLAAIHDLFLAQIHGIRRFGAAALDLCMVGTGKFGAFFEYELSPWDFAAGRLFVEEAGGMTSTCDGQPLGLHKSSLLASNGHLHDAMLDIVRQYHGGVRTLFHADR